MTHKNVYSGPTINLYLKCWLIFCCIAGRPSPVYCTLSAKQWEHTPVINYRRTAAYMLAQNVPRFLLVSLTK